jgi:integrase
VLDSFRATERLLTSIRSAWDISQKPNGKKFNKNDWIPSKVKELKFESICEEHLKELNESLRVDDIVFESFKNVNQQIRDHLRYFNGSDIRDISEQQIKEFYYILIDKGLAKRTIKDILVTLRTLMLKKMAKKDLPEFPKHWNDKIAPKRKKQWMDYGTQILVHEKLPTRYNGLYKIVISLLQETGMRPNEVIALERQDFVDGCVFIWKAITESGKVKLTRKSGGAVTKRLTPELWEKIQEYFIKENRKNDDIAFSYGHNKPLRRATLYEIWKQACEDAKVPYICLYYSVRHSLASRLRKEAEDDAIARIQESLGHSNKQTGKRNYMLNEDAKVEAERND